ncbi:MAG: MBL fold metallo-hydrolase [Candidatus Cloacimonadales bacterium]|nr:MBL fold metallo-hydrolase [Candidatus Cloacimonadales bacterium]
MISAGTWKGDGGAIMGVMPKALWQKLLKADEKNRVLLGFNLLLIQTDGKNILIDTGLGNRISEKVRKIYEPSEFELLKNLQKLGIERTDINYVILTHLHFDHVGGVVSDFDGKLELTFPNAVHIFQKKEWETAKDPDELNRGSYNFQDDLQLLEESGKYQIIEGDFELVSGVTLELTGGHSEGMQIVRLKSEGELAYYAGDIIPMEVQRHLAVNSAFDINRKDSFLAKKRILAELKERNGLLFFAHDVEKEWMRIS